MTKSDTPRVDNACCEWNLACFTPTVHYFVRLAKQLESELSAAKSELATLKANLAGSIAMYDELNAKYMDLGYAYAKLEDKLKEIETRQFR